jgi:hypothetical protein
LFAPVVGVTVDDEPEEDRIDKELATDTNYLTLDDWTWDSPDDPENV